MAKAKKGKLTIEDALVPVDEQPYEIPGNWCWTRLSVVASIYNGDRGKNYPSKKDYVMEGIPFINAGTICDNEVNLELANYITEEKFNALSAGKIKRNDILYCLRGSLGKCAIITEDYKGAISSSLCIMRSENESINVKYLLYLLNSDVILKQQNEVDNGSAQPNLSAANVAKYRIPLPPLAEQKRIVEQIENLFSKLDEAREKAQEAIDSFEYRRLMILYKAFNGDLSNKWREENKVTFSTWQRKALKDCSSAIGDGLHGTPLYDENGEYYFVNGNNFEYDHIEIKPDTKRVNESQYKKYYIELSDKTVFVSINGTLGKTAFYHGEPVILGKSACYVNVTEELDKHYLRFFFTTKEFIDYANNMATGSTIKNLGLKAMRSLEINLPSVEEQKYIVETLNVLLAKESFAKEAAEMVIEQIELMEKSILAKAFRGELGTNNPDDERAIELLRRTIEGVDD